MTPSRLVKIGEALYGPSWRIALSHALEVAERTVRRWAKDESRIPDGVTADLAKLCEKKAVELDKIAAELRNG